MDDTFVLVAAFQHKDIAHLSPRERVPTAMAHAGTSITVTSLTDVVAFLAGSYTSIPVVRSFCQCVFFDCILSYHHYYYYHHHIHTTHRPHLCTYNRHWDALRPSPSTQPHNLLTSPATSPHPFARSLARTHSFTPPTWSLPPSQIRCYRCHDGLLLANHFFHGCNVHVRAA
jgi:hypothetical protein